MLKVYSGNVKKQQKTYNWVSTEQLPKCRQRGGVIFKFIMKECLPHIQPREKKSYTSVLISDTATINLLSYDSQVLLLILPLTWYVQVM